MDALSSFTLARTPRVIFGAGHRRELGTLAAAYGRTLLLVTGGASLEASGRKAELLQNLRESQLTVQTCTVTGEPTPEFVNQVVAEFGPHGIEVVAAVGGGSVLDAGKAIAAMLPLGRPVEPYLEGVGGQSHPGVKLPFLAVPTTAGTGTEATKNASLRRLGEQGFKHSLRHERFVPDVAVVDPELTLTCPRSVTAACGLDALAQLLESFVSPQSSPFTDTLALSGLERVREHLLPVCGAGADSVDARAGMCYAALMSGITLANAGLGVIHSLSSLLGGRFNIPHGVLCGTLLASGMRVNMEKLLRTEGPGSPALKKHARIGELFARRHTTNPAEACGWLTEILEGWTRALDIPRLGPLGLTPSAVEEIAARTPIRNNPVALTPEEIAGIMRARL
jgi:alcohol dehydrogenase